MKKLIFITVFILALFSFSKLNAQLKTFDVWIANQSSHGVTIECRLLDSYTGGQLDYGGMSMLPNCPLQYVINYTPFSSLPYVLKVDYQPWEAPSNPWMIPNPGPLPPAGTHYKTLYPRINFRVDVIYTQDGRIEMRDY